MTDSDLRARRLGVLQEHFESEVAQQFEITLATFNGHPRYEIMPTGAVYDGAEDVMNYHVTQRTAFPDQRGTTSN